MLEEFSQEVPFAIRLEAIASRLEAITIRLEAVAIRFLFLLGFCKKFSHPKPSWCPLGLLGLKQLGGQRPFPSPGPLVTVCDLQLES